jgi:hypothetical protein
MPVGALSTITGNSSPSVYPRAHSASLRSTNLGMSVSPDPSLFLCHTERSEGPHARWRPFRLLQGILSAGCRVPRTSRLLRMCRLCRMSHCACGIDHSQALVAHTTLTESQKPTSLLYGAEIKVVGSRFADYRHSRPVRRPEPPRHRAYRSDCHGRLRYRRFVVNRQLEQERLRHCVGTSGSL